jgi:hypothetical protein
MEHFHNSGYSLKEILEKKKPTIVLFINGGNTRKEIPENIQKAEATETIKNTEDDIKAQVMEILGTESVTVFFDHSDVDWRRIFKETLDTKLVIELSENIENVWKINFEEVVDIQRVTLISDKKDSALLRIREEMKDIKGNEELNGSVSGITSMNQDIKPITEDVSNRANTKEDPEKIQRDQATEAASESPNDIEELVQQKLSFKVATDKFKNREETCKESPEKIPVDMCGSKTVADRLQNVEQQIRETVQDCEWKLEFVNNILGKMEQEIMKILDKKPASDL